MSTQEQFNRSSIEIYNKISKHVPEIEWKVHAPLIEKINKLKKEKNAVILAHNQSCHQSNQQNHMRLKHR